MGNSGRLIRVRHSSRKSSTTRSCRCVQYFLRLSKQWYSCKCLRFLTCTVIDVSDCTRSCTNIVRESALKADSGRKKSLVERGTRPVSVLRLAFQSDDLPTELSRPGDWGDWTVGFRKRRDILQCVELIESGWRWLQDRLRSCFFPRHYSAK